MNNLFTYITLFISITSPLFAKHIHTCIGDNMSYTITDSMNELHIKLNYNKKKFTITEKNMVFHDFMIENINEPREIQGLFFGRNSLGGIAHITIPARSIIDNNIEHDDQQFNYSIDLHIFDKTHIEYPLTTQMACTCKRSPGLLTRIKRRLKSTTTIRKP